MRRREGMKQTAQINSLSRKEGIPFKYCHNKKVLVIPRVYLLFIINVHVKKLFYGRRISDRQAGRVKKVSVQQRYKQVYISTINTRPQSMLWPPNMLINWSGRAATQPLLTLENRYSVFLVSIHSFSIRTGYSTLYLLCSVIASNTANR